MQTSALPYAIIRWLVLLAIVVPLPVFGYMVGRPDGLGAMSTNADLVCKARVVSTVAVTNDSFRTISGFEVRAATLEIISVLKGAVKANRPEFHYYASAPSNSFMMYSPQHYELEAGQSYLFFAKKTDRPGVFRQIRDSHTTKGDEGVTRTLDARTLAGLSIPEAHWLELSLHLTNGTPSNALYAIQQLDAMSKVDAQDFWRTEDFPRPSVLKSLLPFIEQTNEAVAIAALRCFHTEQRGADLLRPHTGTLMKIAEAAPTVPRRVAAITALSGTHLAVVSNALARWSNDSNEEVRSQALAMTPEYPGDIAERILMKHATDPVPSVRAAVARAIGQGRFYVLLLTLEKLLAERGEPSEHYSQESIEGMRQNGIIVNTNGIVSSSAAYALLSFEVEHVARLLEGNLSNEYFKPAFVRQLAAKDARSWRDQLAEVLEQKLKPTNWGGGANPYWDCWKLLHDYLNALPKESFADGAQDRYLRALENAGATGSFEPTRIYELYRLKGLNESAAKFRAECEKTLRYDIAYYFNNVDKKFPNQPIAPAK